MKAAEAIETMCWRCVHNDICQETGCEPKRVLEKLAGTDWHDLRKNPDDLPREKSDIHIIFRNGEEKLVTFFPDSAYKYTMEISHDADVGCINYTDLIAWRYIEPFEEG